VADTSSARASIADIGEERGNADVMTIRPAQRPMHWDLGFPAQSRVDLSVTPAQFASTSIPIIAELAA
jgi:hypothetical protein